MRDRQTLERMLRTELCHLEMIDDHGLIAPVVGEYYRTANGSTVCCVERHEERQARRQVSPFGMFSYYYEHYREPEPEVSELFRCVILHGGHGHEHLHGTRAGEHYMVEADGAVAVPNDDPLAAAAVYGLSLVWRLRVDFAVEIKGAAHGTA